MTKKSGARTFLIGIVIGAVACYLVMRTKTTASPPQVTSKQTHLPVSHPIQMKLSHSARVSKETVNEESVPSAKVGEEDAEKPKTPAKLNKNKLEISLSEDDVSTLEQQWSDLPRQAEASLEERGWRITRLQPDSIFANSGLKEGDLITSTSLQAFALTNDDANLANRVANILNHISR